MIRLSSELAGTEEEETGKVYEPLVDLAAALVISISRFHAFARATGQLIAS